MSSILNKNDIHKVQDSDDLHKRIFDSMKITKFRQESQENLEQSWLPYRRLIKYISQLTHIPSYILNNYIRTIFCLVLLGLMFPLNLLITLFTLFLSYLINRIQRKCLLTISNPNTKRILISGGSTTKALQLCRSFYRAGHQIILVDESINWLTGHRWSNSVERFYVHPSPIKESNAYIKTLANIVRKEKINIFIPCCNSQIDTQLESALATHNCSIFHLNSDHLMIIKNQYTFIEKARSMNLTVPISFLITSRQELLNFDFNNIDHSYICKPAIPNNDIHHDKTIKLPRSTLTETIESINKLSISEDCPYLLQKFISGQEYSTHLTCINGEIKLFVCSLKTHYKHIDRPDILQWCTQYIQTLKLTGHLSLNFIQNDLDGQVYAIECHPYVNSVITSFYNHPFVANAYFESESTSMIVPLSSTRIIYWLPNELWQFCRNIRSMKKLMACLRMIFTGKEAIWSWNDPLPFLLHYHIHFLYLLFDNLFSKQIRFFNKIDCCMGTLA
ncbi:hypothetical protein I4U23_000820 [Adineta vaga]|nr:hypothetical protein I4U23_000820 [Adineta vaga]